MTVLRTGWVLSSGEQINWKEISKLSESSTVALIHPDKTIGSYIKTTEMQDGKVYYYYSSWQKDGTYLYLKKGNQFYKGLKKDGTDKFKEQDIKKEGTNYKTEVERTEKLQLKVQEAFNSVAQELKKEGIDINNLVQVANGISRLKNNKNNIIKSKEKVIREKYNAYFLKNKIKYIHLDKLNNKLYVFYSTKVRDSLKWGYIVLNPKTFEKLASHLFDSYLNFYYILNNIVYSFRCRWDYSSATLYSLKLEDLESEKDVSEGEIRWTRGNTFPLNCMGFLDENIYFVFRYDSFAEKSWSVTFIKYNKTTKTSSNVERMLNYSKSEKAHPYFYSNSIYLFFPHENKMILKYDLKTSSIQEIDMSFVDFGEYTHLAGFKVINDNIFVVVDNIIKVRILKINMSTKTTEILEEFNSDDFHIGDSLLSSDDLYFTKDVVFNADRGDTLLLKKKYADKTCEALREV